MNISWILGLFLFVQPVTIPEHLVLTSNDKMISIVNRDDFSMPLPELPIIDLDKYDKFLEKIDRIVYLEPKNAYIDQSGHIIPEKVGFRLYRKAFTERFFQYFFHYGPATMELPLLSEYPKVDSELLGNIRSKRIGSYVTIFNFANKTRTNNIYLATKAINNSVIFPGDTFSFNQIVGKRTAERGYLRAPVIIRGEFAEDIGGGICQVSSTLFNAIDNAGLQIVQRFSHSRQVPYIPPGRDATVSWYGPDFVFKNKYNQPILIQAKTLGNKLIIKVFSSDVIEYTPRKIPILSF